jgi:hypothetical protein
MEGKDIAGICLLLMVLSIPIIVAIIVCCIMRNEKKRLAQQGERNQESQRLQGVERNQGGQRHQGGLGHGGTNWVIAGRWKIRISLPPAPVLPVHAPERAGEMPPVYQA